MSNLAPNNHKRRRDVDDEPAPQDQQGNKRIAIILARGLLHRMDYPQLAMAIGQQHDPIIIPSRTPTPPPPTGHANDPIVIGSRTPTPPTGNGPPPAGQQQPLNSPTPPLRTPTPPPRTPTPPPRTPTPPPVAQNPLPAAQQQPNPQQAAHNLPVNLIPPIHLADRATLTPAQRRGILAARRKSRKAREDWEKLVNVERPADHDPNDEPDGDEDADGIVSSTVRYNVMADYPFGISTNYTGSRTRTRKAYPERPISWMKTRLGLGKVLWNQQEYEWTPCDEYQILGAAFSKEFLKLLGKHSCEGKSANRPAWEETLRELAKDSKFLAPPVKEILLRYTSLSIGYRGPKIRYEDEKWDQQRRWMWHALDLVCLKIVDNDKKSMAEAVRRAQALWETPGNEWFRDPDNHNHPSEVNIEGYIDPLTGEPYDN